MGQLRGLSERGRQAEKGGLGGGRWDKGQIHGHSLGVALGRHRPLPSADWWEPTQSSNKVREPVTSDFNQTMKQSVRSAVRALRHTGCQRKTLKPGSSGIKSITSGVCKRVCVCAGIIRIKICEVRTHL